MGPGDTVSQNNSMGYNDALSPDQYQAAAKLALFGQE